jgi:hypothetical protein
MVIGKQRVIADACDRRRSLLTRCALRAAHSRLSHTPASQAAAMPGIRPEHLLGDAGVPGVTADLVEPLGSETPVHGRLWSEAGGVLISAYTL